MYKRQKYDKTFTCDNRTRSEYKDMNRLPTRIKARRNSKESRRAFLINIICMNRFSFRNAVYFAEIGTAQQQASAAHNHEGLSLIHILRYGSPQSNSLVNFIKTEYKTVFRAAWSISMMFENSFGLQITEAVSYTHLDVYKRQQWNIVCSGHLSG